jgi:hypothetical protein
VYLQNKNGKMISQKEQTEMDSDGGTQVSREAVYAEVYNEMRRYRDYELNASTWYTVILLGILGIIVSARFGGQVGQPSQLASNLQDNLLVQSIVAIIDVIIGGASLYSIRYANLRYHQLRNYATNNLEPDWHKNAMPNVLGKIRYSPLHTIYLTHFLIFAGTIYTIFSFYGYPGCLISIGITGLLCLIVFRILLNPKLISPIEGAQHRLQRTGGATPARRRTARKSRSRGLAGPAKSARR